MIKVDANSPTMQKIKDARSLKDLGRILGNLTTLIEDQADNASALLKSVSKKSVKISLSAGASRTTDLADLERKGGRKGRSKTPTKISGYKPPKLNDLIKDSNSLSLFAQQIAELEAVKMTLLGDSFSALPNTKKLIQAADKSLKEAKQARDKQLKAMSLAVTNKPKEVRNFSGLVLKHATQTISEEEYSKYSQRSYVLHPNPDEVWYQTYIVFEDLVAADDFLYDNYIFVCTTIVKLEDGAISNHLTSIKTMRIPGTFDIGKEINTASAAKRHVNVLLSADDIHVNRSLRKPLKGTDYATTEALRGTQILRASKHVANVRISNNQIFFKLHEGVDSTEIDEAVKDLKVAMNTLYGGQRKRSNGVKHKVVRSPMKDSVLVVFDLVPGTSASEKTLMQVEQAAKQLGMDKETSRKFKKFMIDGR